MMVEEQNLQSKNHGASKKQESGAYHMLLFQGIIWLYCAFIKPVHSSNTIIKNKGPFQIPRDSKNKFD